MLKMFVFRKKNARFVNCLTSGQAARQKTRTEKPLRTEFLQKDRGGRKFGIPPGPKNWQHIRTAKNLAQRAVFKALRPCHLWQVLEKMHNVHPRQRHNRARDGMAKMQPISGIRQANAVRRCPPQLLIA
jgi:hypothetical protein